MISREELKDFEQYLHKSFPSWSAGTSLSMSVYLDLMFKCPTFSVQLIRILQLFYGLVLRLSKAKLRIKKIDIEYMINMVVVKENHEKHENRYGMGML